MPKPIGRSPPEFCAKYKKPSVLANDSGNTYDFAEPEIAAISENGILTPIKAETVK